MIQYLQMDMAESLSSHGLGINQVDKAHFLLNIPCILFIYNYFYIIKAMNLDFFFLQYKRFRQMEKFPFYFILVMDI